MRLRRWWFGRRHHCQLPATDRWRFWSCDYCGAAYQALYTEPTYSANWFWVPMAGPTKRPERKRNA